MNKVCVMLSAYNGEKYIREQIESIERQKNVEIILLVRDDGSNDKTAQILRALSVKYKNLIFFRGKNRGVIGGFKVLIMKAVNIEADYYAFADQDDVWLESKLENGIKSIEKFSADVPNLYFSNLMAVDAKLCPICRIFSRRPLVSKESAIIRNHAYGCTTLFNRKLLDCFAYSVRARMWMHDYWAYLIAVYLGNAVYGEQEDILYRQHENNVHGAQRGLRLERFKPSHIKQVLSSHPREDMMKDFYYFFHRDMTAEDRMLVREFTLYPKSLIRRWKSAFDKKYQVYDDSRNFFLSLRFILHAV